MKRPRKTVAEQRQERAEAEARCWAEFRQKLEVAQTYEDAVKLHSQAPPESAPGRRFYSNLGFFLINNFAPPSGANQTERTNYLRLIKVFDEAGRLKPGTRQQVEEAFKKSLNAEML